MLIKKCIYVHTTIGGRSCLKGNIIKLTIDHTIPNTHIIMRYTNNGSSSRSVKLTPLLDHAPARTAVINSVI